MIINPNTIIGECLETAWGLPQYMDIISKVNKNDFKASADFRTSFNAYYRVRQRKSEWYDAYYELMENQKHYPLSFEQLLRKLMTFGNIETSFSSKLLATVDVDRPIWDQYVLKSLGRYKEWKSFNGKDKEERISKAVEIYAGIEKWYADFLNSKDGKECVKKFDTILPDYAGKVSDVKKIDFMLVSKR